MIDIRKQMSEDTPENVKAMTKDIHQLARTIPLATGEIQEMIASGLRMGIPQQQIIQYTKDVAKMSIAFDVSAGEISDSMGKISNIFKIPLSDIGDFADAINYLDDNTMAKGSDLINVLQRIGGSAKSLDPKQAAALSATVLSLGESAETAGSGLSAMLNRLGSSTMQSGTFKEGLIQLGLSAENVQKSMSSKATANNTILDVFDRIGKLRPEKQTEALTRLFGSEHGPKLMKLANNTDKLREALEMMNGKYKDSMTAEYAKRVEASAAKMQLFKNRLNEVIVKFGNALLPTLNTVLTAFSKWTDKVSGFIEQNPRLVSFLAKAAALISGVALAGGYLAMVFGGVMKVVSVGITIFSGLVRVFNFIRGALLLLRIIFMAFPIVGWITAIGVAVFFVIKYWRNIVDFFKLILNRIKAYWDGFKSIFIAVAKFIFSWLAWPLLAAIKFFRTVYNTFRNGGKNIVMAIWEGIKSVAHMPVDLIKNMVKTIRDHLPFSPAKIGPLKDIHKIKLVETIAGSIKPSPLLTAFKNTLNTVSNFLFPKTSTHSIPTTANSSVNITINVNGINNSSDVDKIKDVMRREIGKILKEQAFQQDRIALR
ncbi:phage tail tape measure protein [Chitinophaga skermanii]|nr:phage tail tape measure protein [Chitinophaga skermanii]